MSYLTIPLNASHKKKDFNCGKPLLDNYLHTQAKQDVKRKLSACFVLEGDHGIVQGYYTLSSASIKKDILPEAIVKKLPPAYRDFPVTLLGRLAVDSSYRGKRLGELLLLDALRRCYDASENIGSMAVIVDPLDRDAEMFYLKYGFIALPDSGKMFIPMETVSELF
ncbi:MAG: GNAT family N-acetyltransferase [Niastella sp.]|jgi:GNAT superfamily N-acetyltransferase|uniref:GNAT family N-acetyltransferase n=1 Tax=Niastella sp. TaxID=1869183 RepID=UPI00389A59A5